MKTKKEILQMNKKELLDYKWNDDLDSNCSDCSGCFDCSDCFHCFACRDLKNKKYCICNVQLNKEEYEKKILLLMDNKNN